jgi:type I restriction enzyme S subunit
MSSYKIVRRGDFVLAPMALYYGAIGRLSDADEGLVSPAYEVFALDESVDGAFFESLIRSPALIAQYNALSVGGNKNGKRKTTSYDDFCGIEWHLPSRPEQEAIGVALESIDANTKAHDVSIRASRSAKFSTMREILTRGVPSRRRQLKKRQESWPIGRVDGDLIDMPEDWELVVLLSVSRLESGHTPSRKHLEYWNGGVPWLSLNDTDEIRRLVVESTTETISDLGLQNSSARILPTDAVVLTRTAVRGLASRLGRPMATSQDLVAFLCSPRLVPAYLVQVFRHMQREWRRLEAGTSPTNKTIYFSDFERMKVLLPGEREQKEIAEVGDSFDRSLADEVAVRDRLIRMRDAVAQGFFSGLIQVNERLVPQ